MRNIPYDRAVYCGRTYGILRTIKQKVELGNGLGKIYREIGEIREDMNEKCKEGKWCDFIFRIFILMFLKAGNMLIIKLKGKRE